LEGGISEEKDYWRKAFSLPIPSRGARLEQKLKGFDGDIIQ